MASPAFRINGGAVGVKASVSASTSVSATLDSTDGVRRVTWSVIGTDGTNSAASYTLTPSGSIGQTVTWTSGAAGTAGILRCEINSGLNAAGQTDSATRATGKWYVETAGGKEVGCVNEAFESDPTYGWTLLINDIIRSGSGSGGASTSTNMIAGAGLTGGGTLAADRTFNVVANADASIVVNANDIQVGVISDSQHGSRGGGTTHAVAVAGVSNGFISAASQTKLDNLPTSPIASISVTAPVTSTGGTTPTLAVNAGQVATANYLVQRDGSGVLEQRLDAVGVAATVGAALTNTTTATGPNPQWSPVMELRGREASGGDQAVAMGLQTRNAGDTSVVKLSVLSKLGAGSWTEIATVDGAGALGAVSATASSFVSAPNHYAENVYGLDGSSLVVAAGPGETIELRINTTLVATVNDDLFDFSQLIRLPAIAPAAVRHLACYDDGPRWYDGGMVRRAARRWEPVVLDDTTIVAYDGLFANLQTPGTTDVTLPAVAAGDGAEVGVCNDTGSSITITGTGGDTIMGLASVTLANGAAASYRYDGGNNWRRFPSS